MCYYQYEILKQLNIVWQAFSHFCKTTTPSKYVGFLVILFKYCHLSLRLKSVVCTLYIYQVTMVMVHTVHMYWWCLVVHFVWLHESMCRWAVKHFFDRPDKCDYIPHICVYQIRKHSKSGVSNHNFASRHSGTLGHSPVSENVNNIWWQCGGAKMMVVVLVVLPHC